MKRTFAIVGRLLRVADRVRLRREHFGGIAFDERTGTTVDMDRRAFQGLERTRDRGVLSDETLARELCGSKLGEQKLAEAHRLVGRLTDLSILAPASAAQVGQLADEARTELAAMPASSIEWPRGPHLTAPLTVHWAVTYKCRSRCPECYARRYAHGFPDELSLPEAKRLIGILADWGVFELSIGGGEPLEYSLLPAIVREARRRGLVVHVTTGLDDIPAARLHELAESVTGLQMGLNADRLLANTKPVLASLARTVGSATGAGLHVGANLVLSKRTLAHFERLLDVIQQAGVTRVTLLRYKPPADVAEWRRAKPPVEALRQFERQLPEVLQRHSNVTLRLDCALSFLQRKLAPDEALAQGLRGCVAGDRILAVTPDGAAFPCSQLVHARFCAGNLLSDPLDELWADSKVLRRYRLFRNKNKFGATTCGLCAAKNHCGGCRAFADDGWGAEPECPGPLVPAVNQLGKAGRRWDIDRYLRRHGSITVREYMQRYGVGQKRAISELRAFRYRLQSGTGRRQSDVYGNGTGDLIGEIQQMIGGTSGGVAFATRDEVARWIKDESAEADVHYPRWLRPRHSDDECA